jgi:hypothetical protein
MTSTSAIQTLLNVVATMHFVDISSIFFQSVITARRHTPTSALISLTTVVTTKIGYFMLQGKVVR